MNMDTGQQDKAIFYDKLQNIKDFQKSKTFNCKI